MKLSCISTYLRVSYPVQYIYLWYILPYFWFVPAICHRSACPHNSQTILFDDDAVTFSSGYVFIRRHDFPAGCSDHCSVFATPLVTRCDRWCLVSCVRRISVATSPAPSLWCHVSSAVGDWKRPRARLRLLCVSPWGHVSSIHLVQIVSSSFNSEETLGLSEGRIVLDNQMIHRT